MGVSGLAASIRSSTESSTFDLAGHDVTSITSIFNDAFGDDFPPFADADTSNHSDSGGGGMIRLTFIVGAGKKESRNRYDDGASRAVISTLAKLGYVEDRGASCILECGGCYKSQHDTGKNVRTVVVFPRIASSDDGFPTGGSSAEGRSAGSDKYQRSKRRAAAAEQEGFEPLIPHDSPGYKLAIASLPTFRTIIASKCPSWSQKKSCLDCLQGLIELVQNLDDKLVSGAPLDLAEKEFYDNAIQLDDKLQYAKTVATSQLDEGRLTLQEKTRALEHNAERIEELTRQNKPTAKALERKAHLESIEPIAPLKLKYESNMAKVRSELLPLIQLENASRGRLLSIKETRTLARKEELEAEIEALEEASRGWFEDDEVFESRVAESRRNFESKVARKSGGAKASGGGRSAAAGGGGGGSRAGAGGTKWILPGQSQSGSGAGAGTKKKKLKGATIFQAMMMDSSSEEEEDEDESDEESDDDNGGGGSALEVQRASRNSGGDNDEAAKSYARDVDAFAKATKVTGKKMTTTDGKNQSAMNGGDAVSSSGGGGDGGEAPTKKKKKNKKKKKKKSAAGADDDDDAPEGGSGGSPTSASSTTRGAVVNTTGREGTGGGEGGAVLLARSLVDFVRNFVLPMIVAIFGFLVSLVFGGKKKEGGASSNNNKRGGRRR